MSCEAGSQCSGGVKTPCPAGTWGAPGASRCDPCAEGRYGDNSTANTNPNCTGPCASGYWCPPGSTPSTANQCGDVAFNCPTGSGKPKLVDTGYYSALFHINFGLADRAAPEGWLQDTGSLYGEKAGGVRYGWNCDLLQLGDVHDSNSGAGLGVLMDTYVSLDENNQCGLAAAGRPH